jgi:peptidyl-prolyl cis-trans isomerase C
MKREHIRLKHIVTGSLMSLLVACGEQPALAPPPVATVGGAPISQALFDAFVKEKTGGPAAQANAALKESLLAELKQLKAASLAGEKSADAEFNQQLELQRLELLARHAAAVAGIDQSPTEADLKQAYQAFVTSLPALEYHVAHILVATEGSAGVLITRLQGGEDFARLAATRSADDSKSGGGDLGWIAPGKLPAAFTDAAESLKPGAFTAKPVHTSYGWHVIKLLETRPASVPPFEQVRAQLSANLQRERYANFLDDSLRLAQTTR